VRLLSRRPSILFKVAHFATPGYGGDVAEDGLVIAGSDWTSRLEVLLATLSVTERESLFALRLREQHPLPLHARVLLDRHLTDWFPEFLSAGRMVPHFQPIVDLREARVVGREALMRGTLGDTELSGGDLVAAAEAHDALFSFDMRARAAALEVGLRALPLEEILFINLDPRAVLDIEASVRQTWPTVQRAGAGPGRVCLEMVAVEQVADIVLLEQVVAAHRAHGALIALDDLSGGADALRCIEIVRPDVAKLDRAITSGIEESRAKRRLVAAIVEVAKDQNCRVVAEGIERASEFEVMRDLGVDYGQGWYFGRPQKDPGPVDAALFSPGTQLV
jgi:EAL domain-containing protein (putative c-di-GMP-specific phosphodiesterase class I)